GLPQFVDGRFLYLASPEYFAEFAARAVGLGVRLVGGCCGTTPAHVRAMRERLASHLPAEKLAPGAEVRVLETAPAPVVPTAEAILHYTTRDRNRMGLQSDLLGAHALGLRNILCLTGDPPSLGDYPNATAVFDTDAPGLMRIVHRMNEGSDLAGTSIGSVT